MCAGELVGYPARVRALLGILEPDIETLRTGGWLELDPVATFSVTVFSVAAPGVGPVLFGSLDCPSRHGFHHRQAPAPRRAAGSIFHDLPFGFSSVMDR